MTINFRITKKRVILALIVLAIAAGGAALAAWLVSSNGNGHVKVGSLTPPTVVAATAFQGVQLYPGANGDATVTVTNPNAGALVLSGWTINGGTWSLSGLTGACMQNSFTLNPSGGTFTPVSIPGGSVPTNVVLKDAISLANNASTDCQGADLTTGGNPFHLNFSTP